MKELIDILLKVKEKISDESDLENTGFESAAELRNEIDKCIEGLKENKPEAINQMNEHFLPTATFQEHSLQNDWSDEYLKMAERFDKIFERLKKA
jgi:hypothetical protein